MAKTITVTKSRKAVQCKGGHELPPGSAYYHKSPRRGPKIIGCVQHPIRFYEGSSAKTAEVHAAFDERPEPGSGQWAAWLEMLAETARTVGEEYRSSKDGLPENFQNSAPGEALDRIADELEEWANECDDKASTVRELEARLEALDEVKLDSPDNDDIAGQIGLAPEGETEEQWQARFASAKDAAREALTEEIEAEEPDEVPEYEG